jgi:small ligand-binding sensory domain FIST
MVTKKERRQAAQKKAKQKRIIITAACAVCAVAVITALAVYTLTRPGSRVYAVPSGQSVTLYDNGRFTARLFHNTTLSGMFTEASYGIISNLAFTHGNTTVFSHIENDVLLLPQEWWGACMGHTHETMFPLVR